MQQVKYVDRLTGDLPSSNDLRTRHKYYSSSSVNRKKYIRLPWLSTPSKKYIVSVLDCVFSFTSPILYNFLILHHFSTLIRIRKITITNCKKSKICCQVIIIPHLADDSRLFYQPLKRVNILIIFSDTLGLQVLTSSLRTVILLRGPTMVEGTVWCHCELLVCYHSVERVISLQIKIISNINRTANAFYASYANINLPRSVSTSIAIWRLRFKFGCTVGVMDSEELGLNSAGLNEIVDVRPVPEWSPVIVIMSEPSGSEHGVEESRFGVPVESRSMSILLPLGRLYTEKVRLTGHSPVSTQSMMCCNRINIACS